jgi:aminopeptidase
MPHTQENPTLSSLPSSAIHTAEKHLRDTLSIAFEHDDRHAALVVWDGQCALSRGLTEAYRRCLPEAVFMDFDAFAPAQIKAAFEQLAPSDLVVLIQTSNFRLDAFRLRIELFNRRLKVIEHPHLGRMPGVEAVRYIDALEYDAAYLRGVGSALKAQIDSAASGIIDSGGEQLVFAAGFESAKLNIGDYRNMKNVGGQFPIGEVFTESRDLTAVNGRVRIFVFGDTRFAVNKPAQPITLLIQQGRVVEAIDSTAEFDQLLAQIRADEGEVWLRELGFGLNRALSADRLVSDIGTFERMCGVHLSLGAKHGSYDKPNIQRSKARYHIDVFAATESVTLGDALVYRAGAWQV